MFDMNNEEILKYRNDYLFHTVMEHGYRSGLSKEEALSKLVVLLLNLREEAFQSKMNEMIQSNRLEALFVNET